MPSASSRPCRPSVPTSPARGRSWRARARPPDRERVPNRSPTSSGPRRTRRRVASRAWADRDPVSAFAAIELHATVPCDRRRDDERGSRTPAPRRRPQGGSCRAAPRKRSPIRAARRDRRCGRVAAAFRSSDPAAAHAAPADRPTVGEPYPQRAGGVRPRGRRPHQPPDRAAASVSRRTVETHLSTCSRKLGHHAPQRVENSRPPQREIRRDHDAVERGERMLGRDRRRPPTAPHDERSLPCLFHSGLRVGSAAAGSHCWSPASSPPAARDGRAPPAAFTSTVTATGRSPTSPTRWCRSGSATPRRDVRRRRLFGCPPMGTGATDANGFFTVTGTGADPSPSADPPIPLMKVMATGPSGPCSRSCSSTTASRRRR